MEKEQKTSEHKDHGFRSKGAKRVFRKPRNKNSVKKSSLSKSGDEQDFINPMDFWDMDVDNVSIEAMRKEPQHQIKQKGFAVVGTDQGVGKTIAICSLGALLKEQGVEAAAFKPIQCGGEDNHIFSGSFGIEEMLIHDGVYSFEDKEAPYFSLQKSQKKFDPKEIQALYQKISGDHAVTFIELPGGILDPITQSKTAADLINYLKLDMIVVAPLRPGVLNHLQMIVQAAQEKKLKIQGVLFTAYKKDVTKEQFLQHVHAARELMGLPVIGLIPLLEQGSHEEIIQKCHRKISFKTLLGFSFAAQNSAENKAGPSQPLQEKDKKKSSRGRRRYRARKKPSQK